MAERTEARSRAWRWCGALLATLSCSISAHAQSGDPAMEAARQVAELGPLTIPIFDQAKLEIPDECLFLPAARAHGLFSEGGMDPSIVGVILPAEYDLHGWMITVTFQRTGCVRNLDQSGLAVDALLRRYKDAYAKQYGASRAADITRWQWMPFYEPGGHRLTWGLVKRDRSGEAIALDDLDGGAAVLGREGVVVLELDTTANGAAGIRPLFERLTNAVTFLPGKRYEDFSPDTDIAARCTLGDLVVVEYDVYAEGAQPSRTGAGRGATAGKGATSASAASQGFAPPPGTVDAEARKLAQAGPAKISIVGGGAIELPAGYLYMPKSWAQRIMVEWGAPSVPNLQGMIVSKDETEKWRIEVTMHNFGFVRDDVDAELQPNEILTRMREAGQSGGPGARGSGYAMPHLSGWSGEPAYDRSRHVLTWGLIYGDPRSANRDVNLQAMMLGRRGGLLFTMVSPQSHEQSGRDSLNRIVRATSFGAGNGYGDFQSASETPAPLTLADLVVGETDAGSGGGGSLTLKAALSQAYWRIFKMFVFIVLPVCVAAGVTTWFLRRKTAAA